jgi:hypothetical protein
MPNNSEFRGLLDSFIDGSAYRPTLPTAQQAAASAAAATAGLPPLAAAMVDPRTGRRIAVPPNVSVQQNMQNAAAHSPDPFWFYNQVNDGGPWDYKRLTPDQRFAPYGNFNYGATGAAFGWPQGILDRLAGFAQWKDGTSKPGWGAPWGAAPYGDDPMDQQFINQGISYARRRST